MRRVQFAPGFIYHIYNRGTEKRDIFLSDSDRWRFLQGLFLFNDEKTVSNLLFRIEKERGALNFKILREYLGQQNSERKPIVKIILDCLKPNHFHLALEEILEGGISKFMHKLAVGYIKYFNTKYGRDGHLFQGPFQAVRIENDNQLKYLAAYINVINPLQEIEPDIKEAGIRNINKASEFLNSYLWSTHRECLGIRDSIIVDKASIEKIFSDPKEYSDFIQDILLARRNMSQIEGLTLE